MVAHFLVRNPERTRADSAKKLRNTADEWSQQSRERNRKMQVEQKKKKVEGEFKRKARWAD